jgi:hypothetical protein
MWKGSMRWNLGMGEVHRLCMRNKHGSGSYKKPAARRIERKMELEAGL